MKGTPDRFMELIKKGVLKEGVRGLSRSVGISPSIITRYMKGKVGEPSSSTLEKLANYFGVREQWLFGFIEWSEEKEREHNMSINESCIRLTTMNQTLAEYLKQPENKWVKQIIEKHEKSKLQENQEPLPETDREAAKAVESLLKNSILELINKLFELQKEIYKDDKR